ncbi:MAG: PqqD family peptide modification chaperone, partial [Bacteroidales bacterium]|nr:PqqD family peptide modification chaperone [Bacteroidales bacterium]
MRLKKELTLRNVAGEYMILNAEVDVNALTNVYSLNETAAFLWEQFKDSQSFTLEDLYNSLSKE